ncbi:MAG TPA: cytochrome c oxidase subunit II [Acidimicrobiales bacterium]|nr:cytochrome c oxidase subunit II [Acidimicrobiales bacterium]
MRGRRAPLALAVVLLTTFVACSTKRSPSIVDPKGSEAHTIAGVWWLMFGLATAVYVIVGGFIIVAAVRGRGTKEGRPSRVRDNTFVWVGGIIVPAVILVVLGAATVHASNSLRKPETNPLRIEVVGKRWWWAVSYPDQKFDTANEVHIPVGRPIEIGLDSDNVIHSFWVPQLGGKVDLIPGQHNVWRFKATKEGTFRGECAEYCGLEHAKMNFLVVAQSAASFDTWALRHQQPQSEPASQLAANGQVVFMRAPCAGCHTIRGTTAHGTIGPDLTDIGSRLTLGANTVPNTEGYLSGWIVNSQTIKPGNLMPPIPLSSNDLQALVAYLRSLK